MGKLFGFIIGGPTEEQLHPFTKSSEANLGKTTGSTALLSGVRKVLVCVFTEIELTNAQLFYTKL